MLCFGNNKSDKIKFVNLRYKFIKWKTLKNVDASLGILYSKVISLITAYYDLIVPTLIYSVFFIKLKFSVI